MTLPTWIINKLIQQGMKYGIEETVPTIGEAVSIKPLNEGENLVIDELKDPNSPMVKDMSEWDNGDLARAINSPSYKTNIYLQNKIDEYIRTKW